jgi:hypothetical protein
MRKAVFILTKDIFGFDKAIQIDHLTDEQIETLEKIFENYK